MAAQVLFKVACPSCDAMIPVRDSSLVGRKVACPTCKYPFKVENPDGFEAVDEGGDRSGRDDDGAARKPKKKSGNNLMKIGLPVGGVAVAVLGVAGYFLFKGDEVKPKASPPQITKTTPPQNTPATTAPANATAAAPAETKPIENKGAPPAVADAMPPAKNDANPPAPTVAIQATHSEREITNLLPNDSVAVTYIDIEKFRFVTLGEQLFEPKIGFTTAAFKERIGIDLADMLQFVRGENIEQKWSFNVLRTKKPINLPEIEKALSLQKAPPVNGKPFYKLPPNPLLDNLSTALLTDSELKERKAKKHDDSHVMGFMPLDETTVIFANYDTLEQFIKEGCAPTKLTKPTKSADPNQQPNNNDPKGGKGGRSASYPLGAISNQIHAAAMNANSAIMVDDAEEVLTDSPTFLTIEPAMKIMFDRLHNDPKLPPVFTHVIKPQADKRLFERVQKLLGIPITHPNMKIVGVMLNKYELEKFYGTLAVEFFNENDVQVIEKYIKKRAEPIGKYIGQVLGGIKVEVEGGEGGGASSGGGSSGGKGSGGGVGIGLAGIGNPEEGPPSKVRISRKGHVLIGVFEMNLITRAYDRIKGWSETLVVKTRGMVDMASPAPMWNQLAAAGLKLRESNVPRATYPRDEAIGGRLARTYPPQDRVSWMAGLLPHLGHEDLFKQIDTKKDWKDDKNLKAAERLVPEFLDPRYPDRTWFAVNSDDRVIGATHFVGIAGVGMEAADYKADEKRAGAFCYDRPTPVKDVADGLSNSIYMIQVPPNYQRPWLAGGGATVMGVPETNWKRYFMHNHGGKRGTYAIMMDGSVRFISENVTDDVFKALCTIKGGDNEAIGDIETIAPKVKGNGEVELNTKPKDEDD